jgi:hypothetical protein
MNNPLITIDPNATEVIPQESGNKQDFERELDAGKQRVADLMNLGMQAVDDMQKIAFSSQQPEDYATLASLIRAMAKLNLDNVTLSEKKFKLENPAPLPEEGKVMGDQIINNNTIVLEGSFDDMQAMIAKMKGAKRDDDDE